MSDEFLKAARQEIQTELEGLDKVLMSCNNDEHVFKNSCKIESHLHKIKGLAPMMAQDKIGEVAKMSNVILQFIMDNGTLNGSYKIILESVEKMKRMFNGQDIYDTDNFRNRVRNSFPQIVDW